MFSHTTQGPAHTGVYYKIEDLKLYIVGDIFDFVMYYILWTIRAIPTYSLPTL